MIKKKNIALGLFLSLVPCSLSDQCGKEGRKLNRISGGYYPNPSQYPWMVFLNVIQNDKPEFCGGSLISDRLVITAKHCTRVDLLGEALIKIHDRRFNKNKVNVKKVFTHKTGENNDIAIIFLSEPVDLEDPGIGTVCLPESKNEEYIGERVKGMGWGMTGRSEWDPVLKTVDLEVDTYQEPYFLSTKVAKINGVYQDPCAGDSGGPLVHKKNGRWTIIGTISGGGYNCKSGKVTGPAVYNKISEHLPWIKKIMKETEDCNQSCTNFMNSKGFGRCKKVSRTVGALICYVQSTSTCSDKSPSKTNRGKYFSALACKKKDCNQSCTKFMNRKGFGRCKKKSRTVGALICYVQSTSTCSDKLPSKTDRGKYFSVLACKNKESSRQPTPVQPQALQGQRQQDAGWLERNKKVPYSK